MSTRGDVLRVCASLALLLGSGAASAAPAPGPVCDLIVDPRGDVASTLTPNPQPDAEAYDLVGADVASSGDEVTVVFRLADMEAHPTYGDFEVDFFLQAEGGPRLWLMGTVEGLTPDFRLFQQETDRPGYGPLVEAKGTVDRGKREVRVTFSTAMTSKPFRNGTRVVGLRAETSRWVAATVAGRKGGVGDALDRAETGRAYVGGTRSCVS